MKSRKELEGLSALEIRALVRETYQNTVPGRVRDGWSKAEAIAYLSGDLTVPDYSKPEALTPGDTPLDAEKGAFWSADVSEAVKILSAINRKDLSEKVGSVCESLDKTVKLVEQQRTLLDESAKAINGLQDRVAHKAVEIPQPKVSADGGEVTILGVTAPVVVPDPSGAEHEAQTPYLWPMDAGYNPKIWRASTRAGSKTHKMGAADLLKLLLADERICLSGPTGSGKTSILLYLAAAMRWPLIRINGFRDTIASDYLGTYEACPGENGQGTVTKWADGPLAIAMRVGAIFLHDDGDRVPSQNRQVLASVMEPGGTLTLPTGEVVKPHSNFRFVESNNAGFWAERRDLYAAAVNQDGQTVSRFSACLNVDYPTKANEKNLIISRTGCDPLHAGMAVDVAVASRDVASQDSGQLLNAIDMRATAAWCRMAPILGFESSFVVSVVNKASESDRPKLIEIAQRILGPDFDGQVEAAEPVNADPPLDELPPPSA